MIEAIRQLSPISADAFLLTVLSMLVFFVAVPIGVTFYLKHQRRRRRSRKRGKAGNGAQKIGLASDEVVNRPCEHERSKSRAAKKPDGSVVSVCKKCRVPMRRNGPGEWEVIEPVI